MHFLQPFNIPFLVITSLLFLIKLPSTLCANDFHYAKCNQAIKCGNISNLSYPFWGVNRPNYCGQSGFKVQCHDNIPMINMKNFNYRILGMSSSSTAWTVRVARDDYWGTLCPSSYIISATIDFSLYNYGYGIQNLSLYYECNTVLSQTLSSMSLVCSNNMTVLFSTPESNRDLGSLDLCKYEVSIPVLETAALALENRSTTVQVAINGGFELALQIDNGPCIICEASGGKCGVNTDNGRFMCFCQDRPYAASTCSSSLPGFVTGTSAFRRTMIIAICALCISRKRMVFFKKFTMNESDIEEFIRINGSLASKRYSYLKVKKMTNTFKDQIGKGGYGTVYKGILPDGLVVAVKMLSGSKGNGEDFINEVASIGRTSHVNVVTLLGFCYERDKRALIYKYMPNGSLDNFIHKQGSANANCRLEWKALSEIAAGIARGLEYLHRGCNTRILHFDIKPQNILLDKDFCPKISDFGLAKQCNTKESIVSMMGTRGTAGYIAPEVFSRNFGGVSHKSDVYSYGMLVLEMVGARKNLDSGVSHTSEMFPHYIYKDLELENDESIFGAISVEENEIARKMIYISLWCIQTCPSDRPSMSKVVEMLEGPLHSLPIPPKPYLFPATRFADESTTSQPSETG
uniref:probable receptor-like protein kinase At1g67000 n=1 Tax=Fragaria vesca subsp. vesca TaxID=101020 RepID=UPI0005C8A07B|nr:PREDICTED: probable receptor-like protein kinase At1g67000 [Fragaria vesca subsp. vesca]